MKNEQFQVVLEKIKAEIARLHRSGAVGEKTPETAVLRVALENLAASLCPETADVRNLRKI